MKKLFSLTIAIFFASVLFGQTASVIYSFSGDASDISGNGNDGTLSAGTSAINALKIANSVNNYLIVPADVLDGIADLSINFKIKFTGFHTTGLSPTNQIFSGSRSGCVQCFGFSYEKDATLAMTTTIFNTKNNEFSKFELIGQNINRVTFRNIEEDDPYLIILQLMDDGKLVISEMNQFERLIKKYELTRNNLP